MIRSSHAAPDTLDRDDQWRSNSLCTTPQYKGQANLWFPHPANTQGIEAAKRVCAACPVAAACLAHALAQNIGDGIFGGLTHDERTTSPRQLAARNKPAQTTHKPTAPKKPRRKATLRSAWNAGAHPTQTGHILWEGPAKVCLGGRKHTSKQVSFILDRGRPPQGQIHSTCGLRGCVHPAHLADEAERTRCGTRPGYQRHLRQGTEPCAPCRRANADADNRLRWTGTTKAAA